ncbi:hypothetical protein PAUR_a2285 [Pseudoalteromonas aurantia 208]|uniref:Uncharacterized protein n=1 Tax=Pseudoalteromonas aurantia 208 TaxID=1314867 RepID=A0ABR9ECB4_9GAMM|nr:hypothetical protein [Pseudoalteromonas aurantia 208]
MLFHAWLSTEKVDNLSLSWGWLSYIVNFISEILGIKVNHRL